MSEVSPLRMSTPDSGATTDEDGDEDEDEDEGEKRKTAPFGSSIVMATRCLVTREDLNVLVYIKKKTICSHLSLLSCGS